FVTMSSAKEADWAIKKLNRHLLKGHPMMVAWSMGKGWQAIWGSEAKKEGTAKLANDEGDESGNLPVGFVLNVVREDHVTGGNQCITDSDEEISFDYPCCMLVGPPNHPMSKVQDERLFVGIIDSGCMAHLTPLRSIENQHKGGGR